MNKLKKMVSAIFATALAVSLISGCILQVSSLVTAYGKTTSKLSRRSLTMTQASKSYTLKLKTNDKKPKVSWKATIKAENAEDAEPCIRMSVSGNKKSVKITPLRDGKGTIICTVGKKKLKCPYTVELPVTVVSHYSDLTNYLDMNGTVSGSDRIKNFGDFTTSDARGAVYGYFMGPDMMRFDVSGSYNDTSDYYTVSFYIGSDGNVSNVAVRERVGAQEIYKASITSRAASAFKKGCKNINFYTEIQPGATQYMSSCEEMSQKCFDEALQCVRAAIAPLGYDLPSIGFVNYK